MGEALQLSVQPEVHGRHLAYLLAHGLGTTVKRAEYRGFHRDPPLILSRTGYPYSLNKKAANK
jgi:hypothetical protein